MGQIRTPQRLNEGRLMGEGGGGKRDSLESDIAKGRDLAKGNPFIRIT